MVLTAKQQQQVQSAPTQQRQRMRAAFEKQNKQNKQIGMRLHSMPRAQNIAPGIMPDMTKGNWSQTPATSNVVAPRGFGYYDAFEHPPDSAATHMSIGPCTPIVGTTVCTQDLVTKAPMNLTSGSDGGAKLLVVTPSVSATQATLFQCSTFNPTDPIHGTVYTSPQLNLDPPTEAIPTRCSLRIRNWTQEVGVGGIVRVLRATTGFAISLGCGTDYPVSTNQELADFMQDIRSHARTRTYGGEELRRTHQKNCSVVDQSRATRFQQWSTKLTCPTTYATAEPAFTPILILFEPFIAAVSGASVGNTYEVNIRSQFLGHYAQGTMLANMAIDPPSDIANISKYRDHEEAKGSAFEVVTNAIKHGASWTWNHRNEVARSGYAAWKFLTPYVRAARPLAITA
jgi:hypothetical protein